MEPALKEIPMQMARPWGFWASIGSTFHTVVIPVAAQTVVVIAILLVAKARDPDLDLEALASEGLREFYGRVSAIATIETAICAGMR